MGHAELDDGNDSFQQLKDHFWSGDGLPNSPFSARGELFMATLDTEFKHVKTVIKDRLALTPSATMLNLWRFIARSSDSLMVPNIILLMNVHYVMALHTAEVERGFSIHRILKKEGLEDVDPAVEFDVEGNIVEEEDAGELDELESDEDDFPLIDLKKR
ncbi:hypothetical protein FOA52_006722 [Chlamydomonas sp. UWO 241]|nr:hypothetical protein FOA52_006722 [Chlamydomonas sp. UWO 241]